LQEKIAVPAIKAAQGENGSGITYDYYGEEVLAAWRYIPSLRWGLVAKIDASEVFAPVRKLRTLVISVGIFIVFIGALAALAIARATTGPILSLQKGAAAIAAGDLSHRVGTLAQDEVGRLSRAFDEMTEALARDRAGREKAEMEVRKLNDDLRGHVVQVEEANKELEAFSYSVSHDLRSPLRSIDGFSLALLEDYGGKLDSGGRDYLERVRSATQRMSQLIDDLLKLSRVARFEIKRERVDLGALANTIARQLKQNQPERSVDFVMADGLIAHGDERLLAIVVENLFANAWKFSEKRPRTVIELGTIDCGLPPIGSFEGRLHAECGMENRKSESNSEVRNPRSEMVFFVKDNGVGFDMAYAEKLFNPFQRLHKQAEFAGTGIGLATVKRIINRHGGRVWIESKMDEGTTVFFTLG
jgi:signal transduction histidine kinase